MSLLLLSCWCCWFGAIGGVVGAVGVVAVGVGVVGAVVVVSVTFWWCCYWFPVGCCLVITLSAHTSFLRRPGGKLC